MLSFGVLDHQVHFTPVNKIGESRSAYSLFDHQVVDDELAPGTTADAGWAKLAETLEKTRTPVAEGASASDTAAVAAVS